MPSPIYKTRHSIEADVKLFQIRNLAVVGIAASDSNMNVANVDEAIQSVLEVIARLADEVHSEIYDSGKPAAFSVVAAG